MVIFEPFKEDIKVGLHNDELHNLYIPRSVTRVMSKGVRYMAGEMGDEQVRTEF
jgi:hypothetical protein